MATRTTECSNAKLVWAHRQRQEEKARENKKNRACRPLGVAGAFTNARDWKLVTAANQITASIYLFVSQ